MKANLKSIALVLVAFVTFTATAQTTKKVNVEKSKLHWVGKKVTGQHEGTIKLKDGAVVLKGKKLVGGNFTVDMTSISTTDLQGDMKAKLDGHLKAEDFFGVEKFPTSTLVFKKIADKGNNVYTVYGELTIKGITQDINFDLTVNNNSASGKLIIDRTKFGIKYGSGSFFSDLGDRTIYDEFELDVTLSF